MDDRPQIVIVDRSELAKNIYRLLLKPVDAVLIIRCRIDKIVLNFLRGGRVGLVIFNSNIFPKKFDEIVTRFLGDELFQKTQKIFICRKDLSENDWRKRFSALPNAIVVDRPFHPDELKALVTKCLGFRKRAGVYELHQITGTKTSLPTPLSN